MSPEGLAALPQPIVRRNSWPSVGEGSSPEEVLLAIGLARSGEATERRLRPDRRSGIDRRKARSPVAYERRSGRERRQVVRRKIDQVEGPTLLEKARSRLGRQLRRHSGTDDHPDDGLR